MTSRNLIQQLQLQPHPEGGYYRETYRSDETVVLPGAKTRSVCTSIYYLLENENKSAFHKIQSDELWYFHQGEPLEIVCIENNALKKITLGNDVAKGEMPYAKISAHTWFGAKIKKGIRFSLVSCVVAPGFDFADFELAKRDELLKQYPHLRSVIEEFT